ncbi:SpoIIE family protein phosphatase [Sinosporangium siamense]|uniref:Transcription antitermination regulator n=1 Tax=Sinosporangium siamense TaxID=1367973 RepID=A0A919VCC1_9ACTN|nr:SpoIIE family protein phosphatase [Sinosporangium siamense]GII97457.1 transcription antitermination regulator [Sinosporangium siamense]
MSPWRNPSQGRSATIGRLSATIERLRAEIAQAQHAAEGRALIELAKGILVERLRCGPTEAALQLTALAAQAGVSKLELAADLINQAAQDRVAHVARELLLAEGGQSVAVQLREAESGILGAADSQTVAESLLEHALTPLGACSVALWAAGADASLTLVGFAGHSVEEARRWRYVPPGVPTPARRALMERRAMWFTDLGESTLPSIGHRQGVRAGRVAVPAGTGGRILGVLEIGWPEPLEEQPAPIHRQIEALAELCARTLEDHAAQPPHGPDVAELVELADALTDPALVLRPEVDADGQLTDFRIHHANPRFADPAGRPRTQVAGARLLEAYPAAGEEGGLFDNIMHVHATGLAFSADNMILTALIDNVPVTSVAGVSVTRHGDCVLLIWRVQDESLRLANLLQHSQRLGRIGGFEEDAQSGEITWNSQLYELHGLEPGDRPIPLENLREHAHPDDADAIARFLRTVLHHRRPASASLRLRRPDGNVRHIRVVAEPVFDAGNRLLAVRGAHQDVSAQHWTEVALAATRDQLAHSEQQAAERNRLTLQLQHAIMPPTQAGVEAFGLNIAVRYRPAEEGHLVGGDWYDAVVLPSKKVLLSVGDVAGHGIKAATGMVVLRNALRGLATTGAGPAQLMGWLNLVTHNLTDPVTATAICCLYDPETRELRWARAGHLPPVLVRDGVAEEVPLIGGLMLGVISDVEYEESAVRLEPGDTLFMYTDGLVERRDIALERAQEHLLATLKQLDTDLERSLDRILTHSISDTDDDTCLIGVEVL